MSIISVKNLSKTFGTHIVLKDVSFDVEKGDIISMIGSSGSGKSTLLRCINVLETPTSGDMLFHNNSIVRSEARRVGKECTFWCRSGGLSE